jgi:hypothetical protein
MSGSRIATWGLLTVCIAGGATVMTASPGVSIARSLRDGVEQGVGQTPSPLPLSQTIRERGTSVTGAYEGWFYGKDGGTYALVGYFNRNTKQEFDIPVGPNNRIEPGGPDQGQPTHFMSGRQWGAFVVKLPRDLGNKRLSWTLVANGFTNTITLHTQPDYIVEPYEDAASKNTPPTIKFEEAGPVFSGPPVAIATKMTGTVGAPLALTAWVTDEGPKINIPETPAGGRGRGRGRGTAEPDGAEPGGRGRAAGAAGAAAALFSAPRLQVTWTKFRGPGDVKFDNVKPAIDTEHGGKTMTNATFSAPGEYVLKLESNDSTGIGGGGFQCCWTTAHVGVSVKAAGTK